MIFTFDEWYDYSLVCSEETLPDKSEFDSIRSFFDGFITSPNSVYQSDDGSEILIQSKFIRVSKSDLENTLSKFRCKYDKLFLYSYNFVEKDLIKVKFAALNLSSKE